MTSQADFKQLVRERMARTGERYTTARAHLIAAQGGTKPLLAPPLGGEHDQTAAMRDLLTAAGLDVPHTGHPPSEALLLGLGGGIGAAVFTFQYAGHLPHLYVETRCTPQFAYDLNFVQRAAEGLGLKLTVATGTTPKAAARVLDAALEAGRPVLCLLDALALPHRAGLAQEGALPWLVVVHERRGDSVVLTDRSDVTIEVPRAALEEARASYRKGKSAVATLEGDAIAPLGGSVRMAVDYCVRELAGREVRKGFAGNFGLRSIEKWIAEIGRGGKEGWRSRFSAGSPLAAGLRQAYGWVETSGTGGGGFRRMYADFLREGATATGDSRFADVAKRYDTLAAEWTSLFASLLPDGTPLGEIRSVLHERAAAVRRGDVGERLREHDRRLDALVAGCDPFPIDAEQVYISLADGLRALLDGEQRAARELGELVSS